MTFDARSAPASADEFCTVCGRRASECREKFSHLRHRAVAVLICSPECMETFQREPDRFADVERAQTART
jgi:hypothetical protein